MCFKFDNYLFYENYPFFNENRDFLRKIFLLLYVIILNIFNLCLNIGLIYNA